VFCRDCSVGFSGFLCAENIDDCSNDESVSVCLNGGVCADGVNSFTCTCAAGWQGQTCLYALVCAANEIFFTNTTSGASECEDISGWADADGMTCGDYVSEGWCENISHDSFAVNGVSAHEACGASCPDLCGESFTPSLVLYSDQLIAFQNIL
jgi:hypothetical protein